jgi:hypothetical protein
MFLGTRKLSSGFISKGGNYTHFAHPTPTKLRSLNKSVSQSVSSLVSQSVSQSVNQSMNQ